MSNSSAFHSDSSAGSAEFYDHPEILNYITPPRYRRRWSIFAIAACVCSYIAGPAAAGPMLILCVVTPREQPFPAVWFWLAIAAIPVALVTPLVLCRLALGRLLRRPELRGQRQLEAAYFTSLFWWMFPLAPVVIPMLLVRPRTVLAIVRKLARRRGDESWR